MTLLKRIQKILAKETAGAGLEGTGELLSKYLQDTPGQQLSYIKKRKRNVDVRGINKDA